MSRARPFQIENQKIWFDQKSIATVEQLELLADYEDIELDDLLDEGLTQKQVLFRLRLTQDDNLIPADVIERRRQRRFESQNAPYCRICTPNGLECEGRITRHHFVPRWVLRELDNYVSYASRSLCTIPICLSKHRDLHLRGDGTQKSIVPYLRKHERQFAQKALDDLKEQRPAIYDLILQGDEEYAYEAQLLHDHVHGMFISTRNEYTLEEYDYSGLTNQVNVL